MGNKETKPTVLLSDRSYCQMLGVGSYYPDLELNLEHVYSGPSQRAGSAPTK